MKTWIELYDECIDRMELRAPKGHKNCSFLFAKGDNELGIVAISRYGQEARTFYKSCWFGVPCRQFMSDESYEKYIKKVESQIECTVFKGEKQ